MALRQYGIGLDIGIGSVGWCIISWTLADKSDARIEDVGVRLFDSGELKGGKNRKSQKRREKRAGRRLLRRRKHRKDRAKRFLQKIGLIKCDELQKWQELNGNQNIFSIRFKGLTEKLTAEEIADCIIHICNHRGYREFYEDQAEDKDAKVNKQRLQNFESIYTKGNYFSVADMILHDDSFKTDTSFPNYHNHELKANVDATKAERYILISRNRVKQELIDILHKQQEFYPKQLTEQNIKFLVEQIVFAQRDFETGPGEENDKTRKFMGFLDSLGNCRFYKDERRAFRSTVIADIYALVNSLSQFTYIDKKTREFVLKPEAAQEIINTAMTNAGIVEKAIEKILTKYDMEWVKPEKLTETIPNTVKTLKLLKRILEENGYVYKDLISEEQFDLENKSRLHQLCICLSENITPKRRKKALAKLGWNESLQNAMLRQKFGGTASVCERYMLEAIAAFCHGEAYGNFQARRVKEQGISDNDNAIKTKFLPVITKGRIGGVAKEKSNVFVDKDIVQNVVVFKAINETRKVINALIRKYDSPAYINVEVADELGKSFEERNNIRKENIKNQKSKKEIESELVKLGLCKEGEVRSRHILRYKLWQAQKEIDLYTGERISADEIMSSIYDIDHIVPFSLILDDTIHNKALVNLGANRAQKGQQVPLEYLQGEQRDRFLKNVNLLFKDKKISQKKYQYLMLDSLRTQKAQEILAEWKSRNINDTRYITRYIVNYLTSSLKFADEENKKHVFGVKGILTSRLRKLWLNKKTWGSDEKNRENNLHHAADAIVIANMTPACIELASDNIKLNQILRANHNNRNTEYDVYLSKAKRKMEKYYGFTPEYTEKLLTKHNRVPSIIQRLALETDIRLTDPTAEGYTEDSAKTFNERVVGFYINDSEFAANITMPLVSYKQDKKFSGQITDEQAVKKKKAKDSSYIKIDSYGNESVLTPSRYYCVELYKDKDNNMRLRGLLYIDFKKINKKLLITCDYPQDYDKHIMYLFPGDYIRLFDENKNLKVEGYYQSIYDIKASGLNFLENNKVKITRKDNNTLIRKTVSKKDSVKKYNVDILGKIGGEIKCSVPFMFLQKKK